VPFLSSINVPLQSIINIIYPQNLKRILIHHLNVVSPHPPPTDIEEEERRRRRRRKRALPARRWIVLRKVPFLKVLFLLHLLDYLNVAGSRHHPPAEEEEEEEAWEGMMRWHGPRASSWQKTRS
jgi:hypothetical protein